MNSDIHWTDTVETLTDPETGKSFEVRTIAGRVGARVELASVQLDADETQVALLRELLTKQLAGPVTQEGEHDPGAEKVAG